MRNLFVTILFLAFWFYSNAQSGLIAYYPFNGNTLDESGNENNGTPYGGVALCQDRFGNENSAYLFDGIDDWIVIPTFGIFDGTREYSTSAWINIIDQPTEVTYLSFRGEYRVYFGSHPVPGEISYHIYDGNNMHYAYAGLLENNTWYNITTTYKPNEGMFIYVNGILTDSYNYSVYPEPVSSPNNTIGALHESSGLWHGYIDDVRIYNRVLTESEILSLYTAGGWGNSSADLVAYYPFNGNSADESGNGYNLIENGAILTQDRFGSANSAYYFDGNNSDLIDNTGYPGFELSESITLAAWINPEIVTPSIKMGIAGKGNSTNRNYDLFVTPDSKVHFYVEGLDTTVLESNTILQTGKWYYIVGVYDFNASLRLYLNGVIDGEIEAAGIPLSSYSNFAIGCQGKDKCTNYSQSFKGVIDEVRLYRRALSTEEIFELYYENGSIIESNFTSDVSVGSAPLKVKFNDSSMGNVQRWEWDFQSDGTIDSYEKNPVWTYYEPGNYTVSLTISDGVHTDTKVVADFIFIDDAWQCGYPLYDTRNGNQYRTVQIVDQCWMAENLNIGVRINGSEDMQDNGVLEKYCYNDDDGNCDVYGGLYQWNELMQYTYEWNAKGISPDGWHIPSQAEFSLLANNIGGYEIAGGKLKTTGTIEEGNGYWHSPNSGATDEYNFSILPAGNRRPGYFFEPQGNRGYFWTSTETDDNRVWYRRINYYNEAFEGWENTKEKGFSVRCILDVPPIVDLGPDTSICYGDEILLDAGNPGCTYLWSNGETTQTIEVSTEGNYAVTVTNAGGSDSDDINVFFTPQPIVDAGTDAMICENESYLLSGTAQNYESILWSTTGDGTFDDPSQLGAAYTPGSVDITNGLVTLTLTATAVPPCTVDMSDDMILEINLLPLANAGEDEIIYIGYPPYSAQLNATGGITYSWSPTEGLSDPNIGNPIAQPETSTLYTVTVTDENGCTATDDVFVEVMDIRCGNNLNKVLICHIPQGNPNNPQTLCVAFNAVEAHLAHGDYLGPCTGSEKSSYSQIDPVVETVRIAPNPFNSRTTIKLHLHAEKVTGIQLFNPQGEMIRRLYEGKLQTGDHQFIWDGTEDSGQFVGDGFYIIRIIMDNEILHYKIIMN